MLFQQKNPKIHFEGFFKRNQLVRKRNNYEFPIIIRRGMNENAKNITFYFNYSDEEKRIIFVGNDGNELISNQRIQTGEELIIKSWTLFS